MSPYALPISLLAVLGLASAAYLFERRDGHIPNGLTLPGILAGFVLGVVQHDVASHVASFVLFAIPLAYVFRTRILGAGGVKLIAAAGAIAGRAAAVPLGVALLLFAAGAWKFSQGEGKTMSSLSLRAASVAAIAVDFGVHLVKH